MPPASRSKAGKKRNSEEAVLDDPSADQENAAPNKAHNPDKDILDDSTHTEYMHAMDALDVEVSSRIQSLEQQMSTEIQQLRLAFKRSVTSPSRLSLSCLVQYGLNVTTVTLESAFNRQKDLETWVAQTPSLRSSRKHRELQSLATPSIHMQPYLDLLNTSQRMTRATAKKMEKERLLLERNGGAEVKPIELISGAVTRHCTSLS